MFNLLQCPSAPQPRASVGQPDRTRIRGVHLADTAGTWGWGCSEAKLSLPETPPALNHCPAEQSSRCLPITLERKTCLPLRPQGLTPSSQMASLLTLGVGSYSSPQGLPYLPTQGHHSLYFFRALDTTWGYSSSSPLSPSTKQKPQEQETCLTLF